MCSGSSLRFRAKTVKRISAVKIVILISLPLYSDRERYIYRRDTSHSKYRVPRVRIISLENTAGATATGRLVLYERSTDTCLTDVTLWH